MSKDLLKDDIAAILKGLDNFERPGGEFATAYIYANLREVLERRFDGRPYQMPTRDEVWNKLVDLHREKKVTKTPVGWGWLG